MKERGGRGGVLLMGTLYCVSLHTFLLGSEEEESDEEERRVKEDKASPAKEAPKAEDDVKL